MYRCITLHGGTATGWSGRLCRAPATPPSPAYREPTCTSYGREPAYNPGRVGQPKITRYQHRGARNPTILSARLLRTSCLNSNSQTWFQNMHDSETFWNLSDSSSSLRKLFPCKASVRLIWLPFWEAGYLIRQSVAAYGNRLFSLLPLPSV